MPKLDEVDLETEKTLYRNIGYWDGKADRETKSSPGKTRWAKEYVYRALEPFKHSYWDGYWAGYYDTMFNPLKEDAPINNVGSGEIAGVGISPSSKPAMWGEPGKDNKKRFKAMLM